MHALTPEDSMEAEREQPGSKKTIVSLVDRQDWLDGIAEAVQPRVTNLFKSGGPVGQKIKDFLNGVWLGHPLHPAVTDIPVGAWSAAVLLDLLESRSGSGRSGIARAADAAIALGLAGAAGSAVTGLTDWSDTYGRGRKVGVGHALGNIAATALFAASLVSRRKGARETGRLLAGLGLLVATGAAYLGGHLVYGEQIGVDHTAAQEPPSDFVAVLPERELAEGKLTRVQADKVPVVLLKRGAEILAIAETCAHAGGPLSEGQLEGEDVICPWHASRYSMRTGEIVNGPSCFPQPRFETRVANGQIEVRTAIR
jgi:nitrite reductase/ring-hydroxylating ferredoxin subunit/uncharacterized membrane protein